MSEIQGKILVVDDEESIRYVLQRMLEDAGYSVTTATNGSQALEMVAQEEPDLVLLDIKMPGKPGTEVLQELKISCPETEVIMASAVADADIAINAMRDGAYDYLIKPFNANELIITVARALERQRLIAEKLDYQLRLEKKVAQQTQLLEQRVRELSALNNLFAKYLNQGFEAAETHARLANTIIKKAEEIQGFPHQGSGDIEASSRLASDIIKAAQEIQVLAKEAEAHRVEVPAPPVDKPAQ